MGCPDVTTIGVLVGAIEQQPVELLLGLGGEGVVEGEVDNLQSGGWVTAASCLGWLTCGLWARGTTTSSPLQWQLWAVVHWSLSHLHSGDSR